MTELQMHDRTDKPAPTDPGRRDTKAASPTHADRQLSKEALAEIRRRQRQQNRD